VFGLFSLQGLRFLLKLPTTIGLRQGLEPNFLKLLRMPQLVLSHTHWQAHQRKIKHDVCFSGIFPSHWSIARTNTESQSMHWLIMLADQVIGGAAQRVANIKIQKTGA
jgi:hypothetical protein